MGVQINEVYRIDFNGQVIIGTYSELEELCLALEEALYDEPTYEELSEKVLSLELYNEQLIKDNNELRGVIDGRA